MRPDMGKCVIERPRRGSRTAFSAKVRHYGKITNDVDGYDYDGFTRFPVSRKQEGYNAKLGYKTFTDLLGPLNAYLTKNCGRLWDDVYSEIAYNLGRFTRAEGLRHIISQHLNVGINTWRGKSGKIYVDGKYGTQEVGHYRSRADFYVEPETGILRESPVYEYPKRPDKPVESIPLCDDSAYQRINGIWYFMFYGEESTRLYANRDAQGRPVYDYFKTRVVKIKRQLGKKELRGLRKFA